MKKAIKMTSSVLACTLLLSNINNIDITKAAENPTITVNSENSNISAKIHNVEDKYYLTVTATQDVTNIAVRVNVSNNQTFVFKHNYLSKGETVDFELNIADKKQVIAGKMLPKTDVVKEELELKGVVKGFNVVAKISYDVEVPSVVLDNEKLSDDMHKAINSETNSEEKLETSTETVTEKQEEPKEEKEKPVAQEEKTEKKEPVVETPTENVVNTVVNTEEVKQEPKKTVATETVTEKQEEPKETAETPKMMAFRMAVKKEEPKETVTTKKETITKTEEVNVVPSLMDNMLEDSSADSALLVDLLNKHRVANGKKPLEVDDSLSKGTLIRANEIVVLQRRLSALKNEKDKNDFKWHVRLDGKSFNTAFSETFRRFLGENVAWGSKPESLMEFWKNSKAHNDNALNDKYTKVSIKVVKVNGLYYGVQIFR